MRLLAFAFTIVFVWTGPQDSIPCVLPTPTFFVFSLNALLLLLSALSLSVVRNRNTPLIRTLFLNFHGKKIKRKRRVASFRTQPYNILVRDWRDTRNFRSRCCKNIRRGNFTETLASNTANGLEASLYSRCAQQSITRFYLASPILKASCSCIHIYSAFLKAL